MTGQIASASCNHYTPHTRRFLEMENVEDVPVP
jgi:hypothetical protein